MKTGRILGTAALITALTLMTACADASAPSLSISSDREPRETPAKSNAQTDFYRAEGLPQLYGSACGNKDRAVIGIQYTHSNITGEAWRGSRDASEEFVRGRGKYGEDLRHDSGNDGMRLYAHDYYARGRPGELVIIGRSGTSSSDRCMIGVLTDEKLPR